MSETNRRHTARVTYFAEAELEGIDVSRVNVRLSDISPDGAFVDSRTVLPAGATAKLRFTLLGREITVQAEVRYSMPSFGMGIRFLDLQPDDRRVIDAFVASAS
jgi:hypothetical protein